MSRRRGADFAPASAHRYLAIRLATSAAFAGSRRFFAYWPRQKRNFRETARVAGGKHDWHQ
jgi:hypothetical protein